MKKLTVNEAKNKVTTSDNAVLIDCRPKEDYAHGHVAGAINFPIEKITEERVCRRLPDKTTGLYIIGSYYHKPNVAMKKFKKLRLQKSSLQRIYGRTSRHADTLR